jgi:photosystem II stability/assembly factor-like uncharacterized protein
MRYLNSVTLALVFFIFSAESEAQWERVSSSPSGNAKDIVDSNGIAYLGYLNIGVFRSSDSTETWEQINNGLNTLQAKSIFQMLIYNEAIYAATIDGIYKSTDGGDNWVKKSEGITIGPGAIYEFTASIFEYNDVLFTGAWNGIYRSTDFGESWEITNVSGEGIFPGFFINHYGTLFLARENINTPYGYVSSDDGETWEPLSTISGPTITFFSEPNRLWAGTIFGVWLSTDNGDSWVHRSEGLPPDPYNSSIIRVNGKLVSSVKFGGSGVFYSDDDGEYWADFSNGLPFLNSIEKLIVYGDRILAATSDGLWQRDTTDVVTGLADNESDLPRGFLLSQNYPNPFNARTTIGYSLSEPSEVTIEIFDILGRRVAEIHEGEKPAGEHRLSWSAEGQPSGVYFYQIQAGDYTETRKMLLLR